MGIVFTQSADKHSIPREDALHAIYNAVFTSTDVKASADQPVRQRRLFVGAQHDQTDRLIEILVEVRTGGEFVIYHVMPLGSYYRRQMEEQS